METSDDDVIIGNAVQEIVPSDTSDVNRETVVDCVMCMFCREAFKKQCHLNSHLRRIKTCNGTTYVGVGHVQTTDADEASICSSIGSKKPTKGSCRRCQ